jgi:hypothetical protein
MADNPLVGVSGPGSYSKRTDVGTPEMKLGSIAYGEGKETQALKSGAPLASTPDVTPSQAPTVQRTPLTPLYAPTEQPDVPVTEGIDMGAGAGSEALALRQPDDTNFIASITAYKPVLNFIADQPNTSPETRAAIRQLWDSL